MKLNRLPTCVATSQSLITKISHLGHSMAQDQHLRIQHYLNTNGHDPKPLGTLGTHSNVWLMNVYSPSHMVRIGNLTHPKKMCAGFWVSPPPSAGSRLKHSQSDCQLSARYRAPKEAGKTRSVTRSIDWMGTN